MQNMFFPFRSLSSVLFNDKHAKFLRLLLSAPYNFVTPSPWPLLKSLTLLNLTLSGGATLHNFNTRFYIFALIFLTMLCYFTKWNGNVIRDASYIEDHTNVVSVGLRIGFLLFMVSEAMLFVALFWSFFHSSLETSASWTSFYKCFTIFWGYINAPAMGIKWSLFLGISLDGMSIKKVKWNPIFYLINKR